MCDSEFQPTVPQLIASVWTLTKATPIDVVSGGPHHTQECSRPSDHRHSTGFPPPTGLLKSTSRVRQAASLLHHVYESQSRICIGTPIDSASCRDSAENSSAYPVRIPSRVTGRGIEGAANSPRYFCIGPSAGRSRSVGNPRSIARNSPELQHRRRPECWRWY